MKALSFSRPWDYLVLHPPFKDIDNRSRRVNYRGKIYVHRAKSWDEQGYRWILAHAHVLGISGATLEEMAVMRGLSLKFPKEAIGQIMGEVEITGCVEVSDSPWFFGPERLGKPNYGLVLANPVVYQDEIVWPGLPGLFNVPLCRQCHMHWQGPGRFCDSCSQVALEDDCAPD